MMRCPRPLLWLGPLLALLLSACSRSDDASSRSAAAAASDPGILKDQSGYTPAKYESLVGGSGGATPAAGGGGVEDAAIRAALKDTLTAVGGRNIDGVLAAFDPAQVAPLLDLKSRMLETIEKVESFSRQASSKSPGGAEADKQMQAIATKYLPQLADGLSASVTIELLSPTEANLGVDPAALQQNLGPVVAQLIAEVTPVLAASGVDPNRFSALMGGAAAPGEPPTEGGASSPRAPGGRSAAAGGGSPTGSGAAPTGGAKPDYGQMIAAVKVPLRKVDERWRFALPRAITPAEGALVGDALKLGNEYLDRVSAKIEMVPALDPDTMNNILLLTFGEMAAQFAELQARFAALVGMPDPNAPDPNAADPNKPPEPPPPDAPPTNPRVPGRAVQP